MKEGCFLKQKEHLVHPSLCLAHFGNRCYEGHIVTKVYWLGKHDLKAITKSCWYTLQRYSLLNSIGKFLVTGQTLQVLL